MMNGMAEYWLSIRGQGFHISKRGSEGNMIVGFMDNSGKKLQQEQHTCDVVLDRINAILEEWKTTLDIRIQIQYATIIIKKIEHLKKMEYIARNEVRKKMCTLLRNKIKFRQGTVYFRTA